MKPGTADGAEHWGHDLYEQEDNRPAKKFQQRNDATLGTKVRVTKLHFDVMEDELKVSCSVF